MSNPKIFNCSVVNIDVTLGFNGQDSVLNLTLVEDCGPYNGSLGCVYDVNYFGLQFRGVIAEHNYSVSSRGMVWTVRMSDGRQSLKNVAVIMDDYYCPVSSSPNIINALAKLEPSVCGLQCADFMKSSKDENGIPLLYVLRAIQGETCFIPVCQVGLTIDISAIINICPVYAKITDTYSDVLTLIDVACSEAGADFVINIVGNTFVATPISRKFPAPDGALGNLLTQIAQQCNGGATVDTSYGEETTYEPAKKFVLGENYHYFIELDLETCSGAPGGGPGTEPPSY